MRTHWPGCSAFFQPADWATSCSDPGVPTRCAPVMRWLEGKHIAQLEGSESCSQGAILAVEVVSHHCSKRDSLRVRPVDQFQCDREFCPKSGIVLTFLKVVSRGVR